MVILLYSFLEAGINQLTETSTMLKLPLMLINFIGLFFLHFFSVSEITIQNMAPSTLTPGEKVLVEVSIVDRPISEEHLHLGLRLWQLDAWRLSCT
jgi:hypothetical protein